jgi:hypothetical protein
LPLARSVSTRLTIPVIENPSSDQDREPLVFRRPDEREPLPLPLEEEDARDLLEPELFFEFEDERLRPLPDDDAFVPPDDLVPPDDDAFVRPDDDAFVRPDDDAFERLPEDLLPLPEDDALRFTSPSSI